MKIKIPIFSKGQSVESLLKISKKNKELIENFIKDITAEGISENRKQKYRSRLIILAYVLDNDFDKATRQEIKQLGGWINSSRYSAHAKHDFRVFIKKAFKFWKGGNDFYPEEVRDIRPPKGEARERRLKIPDKTLTKKDVERLVKLVGNNRDKLYLMVSWDTAGRPGEILALKWNSFISDKKRTRVKIITAKKSGDYVSRQVLLYYSLPYLNRWREEFKEVFDVDDEKMQEMFVFQNLHVKNNKPLSEEAVLKMFHYLREKIKMPGLVPKWFRHSKISKWQRDGLNDQIIKQIVGHSKNYNVISEYSHHNPEDLDNAILEAEGIKEKKKIEDVEEIIMCIRCNKENKPKTEYCEFCGFPLSEKAHLKQDTDFHETKKEREALNKMMFILAKQQLQKLKGKDKKEAEENLNIIIEGLNASKKKN